MTRWTVFATRCACGCGERVWMAHGPDLVGLLPWRTLAAAHDYAALGAVFGPREALRVLATRERLRRVLGGGRRA